MRIFRQFAPFAVLNLFSCAEVVQAGIPLTLNDVSLDAMRIICSYLDDPFSTLGFLNRHFKELFSTEILAKSIFKERFDIPELVTDEIGNNEPELKFIIASFSKFKNPDHLYEALRYEFLKGSKFDTLLPNLKRFFNRCNYPNRSEIAEVELLIERKKYNYMMQMEPKSFKRNSDILFDDDACISNFQKYLLSNPEHLEDFKTYNLSAEKISSWIKVALVTNMPDSIFHAFPQYSDRIFRMSRQSIWISFYPPKHLYPEIFERINFLIDNLSFERDSSTDESEEEEGNIYEYEINYVSEEDNDQDEVDGNSGNEQDNNSYEDDGNSDNEVGNNGEEDGYMYPYNYSNASAYSDGAASASSHSSSSSEEDEVFKEIRYDNETAKEIYRLLNLIRFGPDNPTIFEEKIKNMPLNFHWFVLMCRCASLANKMDLFSKIFDSIGKYVDDIRPDLNIAFDDINPNSIEELKFILDINEIAGSSLRHDIYDGDDFLEILSKHYRVIYIKWTGNELIIEFKIAAASIGSGFPEIFRINRKSMYELEWSYILLDLVFDNAAVLESFLVELFNNFPKTQLNINDKNLKLVLKSESILQLIKQSIYDSLIPSHHFVVAPEIALENYCPDLVDIAQIGSCVTFGPSKLKTADLLKRYELILGHSASNLLKPDYDYFKYRHVFKYLVESGKELPSDLPEKTRTLLKIEFPLKNF